MEQNQTRVLRPDSEGLAEAAATLRAGGLVAFPTETVYGLGANALDAEAAGGIFRAKGRPAEDPLIVHLAEAGQLERVARAVPAAAHHLAEAFWPGPLTLVLPKQPTVPHIVTAGLETVAVRVPSHPVALALLRATDLPVAAPSANLFAHPSPTRAEHVLDDLNGRIDAVVDGGPTQVGLESTIIDLASEQPRLLRPGGLPAEAVEAVLGISLLPPPERNDGVGGLPAPGLLEVHYAPRTPLVLIRGEPRLARQRLAEEVRSAQGMGRRVGALLLDEDAEMVPAGVTVERVGSWSEPAVSASRLFDALRRLDQAGLDLIVTRELADPHSGLGRALADRLRRAAARRIEVAT